MEYDAPLYRPPSEAFSLILQVTLGCSHNGCRFCGMYKGKKFKIRPWEDIEKDINEMSVAGRNTEKIFLADGNALTLETTVLTRLLEKLYRDFPLLKRVTAYAGPLDIINKTAEELKLIREAGLTMLYLGLESGNEEILRKMNKGVNAGEMVLAGRRAIDAGFSLSVTVIIGLGGREKSKQHAVDTARVLNSINPMYVGALTLMPVSGTALHRWVREGQFEIQSPLESLREIMWLLDETRLSNCVFRCNHASNYLPLKGVLDREREMLVTLLGDAINNPARYKLKPEFMRGL